MTAVPAPARPAPRRGELGVAARAFASVDVHADLPSAAAAWAELSAVAPRSGYQSQDFAGGYLATLGADRRPFIVVARDARGLALALLPLGLREIGPLALAEFLGDAWANYRMGLFRPGVEWTGEDLGALLRAAAAIGRPRVDAFLLFSQPESWNGTSNPLVALPRQPSPSFARASRLPGSFEAWVDSRFSKPTKKKLRKKLRKLEALGPVRAQRAETSLEAERLLDVYFTQRRARAQARGTRDSSAEGAALLRRLASFERGPPALEMHGLMAGERIVATFGALGAGGRLSGLILSFDGDPAVAAASPGEQLVIEVARDAIARGFDWLDLGAGEARYKNECCEIEEPLFDSAIGLTARGRLAARAALAAGRLKRWIKRRPGLHAAAKRALRWAGR